MDEFDYVIVGGGTAGSLLAYRLTENDRNSVCVLEAGPPDRNPYIRIPAGFTKTIFDPRVTWQFETQPDPRAGGRRMKIAQGRTLGGSSAINGMVYNRGPASDFDRWEALGNCGWSYRDILPYFMKTERRIGPGDDRFRGRSGRLTVTTPKWKHPLVDALIEAAVENGVARNPDYNGEHFGGVGLYQDAIHRGRRVSSAHAFLHPAKSRRSLALRTSVLVTRILFDKRRAVGVLCSNYDDASSPPTRITARKAVIVSAGTLNSPKLLQLSGVGPASLLREHGIEVVHALEGVGENLRDHYGTRMVTRTKGTDSINTRVKGLGLPWEVAKWLVGAPSVVGLGPATVHAYCKSVPSMTDPDFVLLCTPACFKPDFSAVEDFPGITIGAYPIRPESTGSVRIASSDSRQAPLIRPNYLSAEADQRTAVAAGRAARQLMLAPAMRPYFDAEIRPGYEVQRDDEWLANLRTNGMSSCHWAGSCRMGPASDATAVVDDNLRVHGLDALYVVDASIMPRLTSSNTCAPTMMIAEKTSDMLLAQQQ
ncbi:MAG: GMC family oxidoreductase N-terminal domain-containing protein [Casimicrobiaceae bacterium]